MQDAQNAFDIIETYERSYQFFCYFNDLREEERDNEGLYCSKEDKIKEDVLSGDNSQAKNCKIDQTDSQTRRERSEGKLPNTGKRPYKCSQCPKSFTASSSLQSHMFMHAEERPFKCSRCPKSFARSSNLSVHLRTHAGDRPFNFVQSLTLDLKN